MYYFIAGKCISGKQTTKSLLLWIANIAGRMLIILIYMFCCCFSSCLLLLIWRDREIFVKSVWISLVISLILSPITTCDVLIFVRSEWDFFFNFSICPRSWKWIDTSTWTQKMKGRQGDCPGRHWGRWSLLSTSPVTARAVILTKFRFWIVNVLLHWEIRFLNDQQHHE